MRISEVVNVKAPDFNWKERTSIVLGKHNRYHKTISVKSDVKHWFMKQNISENALLLYQ